MATGARIHATKFTTSSRGSIPHFSAIPAPSVGDVYHRIAKSKSNQHQSYAIVPLVYSCRDSEPTVNALSIYSWLMATS